MSKNINDRFQDNLEFVELPDQEKKSLLQKYLKKPFSVAWSKLMALITPTQHRKRSFVLDPPQFDEEYNSNSTPEKYFYCRFTDRVDPSLYTILFHQNRF